MRHLRTSQFIWLHLATVLAAVGCSNSDNSGAGGSTSSRGAQTGGGEPPQISSAASGTTTTGSSTSVGETVTTATSMASNSAAGTGGSNGTGGDMTSVSSSETSGTGVATGTASSSTGGTLGSCCTQHPGLPGCDDEATMQCVCALDSYCCSTEWDATCIGEAQSRCGACGGSSSTSSSTSTTSTGTGTGGSCENLFAAPCGPCLEEACCAELAACEANADCWGCVTGAPEGDCYAPVSSALIECMLPTCHPQCSGAPGESCLDPIDLGDITGDSASARANIEDYCCWSDHNVDILCEGGASGAPNDGGEWDVVYQFSIASPQTIDVYLGAGTSHRPTLYVRRGDCDSGETLSCLAAYYYGQELLLHLGLQPAGTYFVFVDSADVDSSVTGVTGDFELAIHTF